MSAEQAQVQLETEAFDLVYAIYGTKIKQEVEKWLANWVHADAVDLRLRFAQDPGKYLQAVLTLFALEKYHESIEVLQKHFGTTPSKIII